MEGKRQLEKRDFGKRLSLDSSLVEYMDSNKYIEHLLTQLEEQHRNLWREKLAVARLQREVAQRGSEGAMHEKLMHELEEERHLRLQSEKRLQEVTLESERNRIQMRGLQQQFSRMEETVRNLLKSQGPPEQKKEETVNIMVYQEKLAEDYGYTLVRGSRGLWMMKTGQHPYCVAKVMASNASELASVVMERIYKVVIWYLGDKGYKRGWIISMCGQSGA
ncbi:nck-associated protein 5-like [Lontra canadensis]|uniref:nck-associated protein 5-like n=1 Tax=Lontra canadensis TaxID=76717 RepID=UPI0013F360E1|nr:nck-associated protein 5-like [Lontra canadensis]